MNEQAIVSKMNEYLHSAAKDLCTWLAGMLPRVSDDWWQVCVMDNLSFMKDFEGLTPEQKVTLDKARAAMEAIPIVPCTTCNYCAKVCPMNVGISGTFNAFNTLTVYDNMDKAKGDLDFQVNSRGKAKAIECIKCGACMEVCPQHLEIPDLLEKAAAALKIE